MLKNPEMYTLGRQFFFSKQKQEKIEKKNHLELFFVIVSMSMYFSRKNTEKSLYHFFYTMLQISKYCSPG